MASRSLLWQAYSGREIRLITFAHYCPTGTCPSCNKLVSFENFAVIPITEEARYMREKWPGSHDEYLMSRLLANHLPLTFTAICERCRYNYDMNYVASVVVEERRFLSMGDNRVTNAVDAGLGVKRYTIDAGS